MLHVDFMPSGAKDSDWTFAQSGLSSQTVHESSFDICFGSWCLDQDIYLMEYKAFYVQAINDAKLFHFK